VRRLDRSVATGFLLTLALTCSLVGGVLLGVLVYLVRSVPALQHVDNSVADWGYEHRTSFSTAGLRAITDLGSIQIVVGLALALAAIDFYRTRSRWSLPFLLTVMAGMELLTLGVKDLVGRVRPALDPAAASLGPSFPSGHSATSAAFYAAAALILGRTLPRRPRQILTGLAVGIAVAVAASRVLLDLHWLSDVVGGLALGWGWFALCAVVFGGRLLRPTAGVDIAAVEAAAPESEDRATRPPDSHAISLGGGALRPYRSRREGR
jgi:membrane-associated phospholipid phosphatase